MASGPESSFSEGEQEVSPPRPTYPPYAPYSADVPTPSIAKAIVTGKQIRVKHKSKPVTKPAIPPPRPALPKGPRATDVPMPSRAQKAHERCMRRHTYALTDRVARMSKPLKRSVVAMWRDNQHLLSAATIYRLRNMLDADEPFNPDQAYQYFTNIKRSRRRKGGDRSGAQAKKDLVAMVGDRRFIWARNATVAFARGIQHRLSRPGKYALADNMLRLSNIILEDLCGYMHMRTPPRRCTHPKGKFILEMADKIAVWIDEILQESDDRMLMMDFDEDDDVKQYFEGLDGSKAGTTMPPRTTPEGSTPHGATSATTPATTPAGGSSAAHSSTNVSKDDVSAMYFIPTKQLDRMTDAIVTLEAAGDNDVLVKPLSTAPT